MTEASEAMRKVWRTFAMALDAELSDKQVIRGGSGLEHDLQSLAFDEKYKRLIIVSSEANSRAAALVQIDIQSAYPEYNVLLARPLIYDLAFIARSIAEAYHKPIIDINAIKKWADDNKGLSNEIVAQSIGLPFTQMLAKLGGASQRVKLPPFEHVVDICRQALALDWKQIAEAAKDIDRPTIPLDKLALIDNLKQDRVNGICPLPFYEFSESNWATFADGTSDDIVEMIQSMNIYQYFFPPPDGLALSLVEQGISQPLYIKNTSELAPKLGHSFGRTEYVKSEGGSVLAILDELAEKGYVAEGEHGVEVTEEGRTIRTNVKFRPREGLLTKLLNRASLNMSISPKDLFPR